MRILSALVLFLLICGSTSFGFTTEQYDDLAKSDSTGKFYLKGVGDSLQFASVWGEGNGHAPLFCPPEKFVLTADNFDNIYTEELEKLKKEKGVKQTKFLPVGLVMLLGLQSTFPCKSAQGGK